MVVLEKDEGEQLEHNPMLTEDRKCTGVGYSVTEWKI